MTRTYATASTKLTRGFFAIAAILVIAMLLMFSTMDSASAQSPSIYLTTNSLSVQERDDGGYSASFGIRPTSYPVNQVVFLVEIVDEVDAKFQILVENSYGNLIRCDSGTTNSGGAQCEVRFDPVNWNTLKYVSIGAVKDDDGVSGTAKVRVSVLRSDTYDPAYKDVPSKEIPTEENDLLDPPTQSIDGTINRKMVMSVGEGGITVPEGSTATYEVWLNNAPESDVTVTLTDSGDSDITIDTDSGTTGNQNTLTFTSTDWNRQNAKTVTLSAGQDADGERGTKRITHSADRGYDNVIAITATEGEDETAEFVVNPSPASITLTESDTPLSTIGSSHAYTVKLSTPPTDTVTVGIALDTAENGISVSTDTLTFTSNDWSTTQTVTITAPNDSDYTTDTATVVHTVSTSATEYEGLQIGDIKVTAVDDDAQLILSQSALTIQEGGSATYTVYLNPMPSADVTVTITEGAGGDTDIRITNPSSKTLTFTPQNYDTPQTITVRANSDSDADNGARTITHEANGTSEFTNITGQLTVTERDSQARINVSSTTVTVVEEASATYNVSLNGQPAANVAVTIAEATTGNDVDADITVTDPSGKTLTFTPQNYATPQSVTLAAAEDQDLADGRRAITHTASDAGATHSGYAGATVKSVTAREDDIDTGGIAFADSAENATTTVSVNEEGTGSYKVKLTHKPTGTVNVQVRAATGGSNDTDITV